jgi:hypothetical protein
MTFAGLQDGDDMTKSLMQSPSLWHNFVLTVQGQLQHPFVE